MNQPSKIRLSARGEHCTVRIPTVCNHDPSTVVLAHLNGAGMGMKAMDLHGAYCCSACHDVIDQRVRCEYPAPVIKLWFFEGMVRTQTALIEKGLIRA